MTLALRKQRQENLKFKDDVGYMLRPYHKNQPTNVHKCMYTIHTCMHACRQTDGEANSRWESDQ